jgi:N-methylhydantoinase B
VASGGGGYGDPALRDAELVRCDVRDGIVSRGVAEEIFGVVVFGEEDPVIDIEATARRRAQLSGRPRGLVSPTGPGAATWLQETMREGDVYLVNPA